MVSEGGSEASIDDAFACSGRGVAGICNELHAERKLTVLAHLKAMEDFHDGFVARCAQARLCE